MLFEIQSHNGVGPIRFGMTSDEVRAALGTGFESFRRTSAQIHPCDYFEALGCFVNYDENGSVEAVEFAEPARPTLDGMDLLILGFADLAAQMSSIDPSILLEDDGFTSLLLGIGAWAPAAGDEPLTPPESVIVFVRGYYD